MEEAIPIKPFRRHPFHSKFIYCGHLVQSVLLIRGGSGLSSHVTKPPEPPKKVLLRGMTHCLPIPDHAFLHSTFSRIPQPRCQPSHSATLVPSLNS